MNRLLILLLLLGSCNYQPIDEDTAWRNLLLNFEVEKSYECFNVLIDKNPENKKNYLGLAYTELILDKGDWSKNLNKFSDREEDLWRYGHLAILLKTLIKDSTINTELNINEFRALHLDGKFKTERGFKLIEGEYKDLKPYGSWKYYKLNGEFIKEEKY